MLGPDITFAKLSAIPSIHVTPDGTVTEITADLRLVTHQLKEKFLELSGFIIVKTIDPLEKYVSTMMNVPEHLTPPTPVAATNQEQNTK
jgi:hypothetical protein